MDIWQEFEHIELALLGGNSDIGMHSGNYGFTQLGHYEVSVLVELALEFLN